MRQHIKDVYNFSNTSSKEQLIYHEVFYRRMIIGWKDGCNDRQK